MTIAIVFYKSSSKYYDSICMQCKSFGTYLQEKSKNTFSIEVDEIKANIQKFSFLLGTVKSWTKTEYYIDGIESTASSVDGICSLIECCRACEKCVIKDEYCYDEAGWGCKQICSVALRKENYYSYRSALCWFDFGHFENERWMVDSEKIHELIKTECREKHLDLCDNFDVVRINEVLRGLPKYIDVVDGGDWQYKYRAAPIGMQQTEIVGIKPAEKGYGFSHGVSISLSANVNGLDDLENGSDKNIPDISFKDIGGIDEVVSQVREVIELPIVAPKLFEHYRIRPHRGILLYGPPGCGKTLIAKAIANEIKAHFIAVSGPEILNKFVGQSESNLRSIFKEANELSPSIIYFDEFDSISATRDAEMNPLQTTVVNQLLTLMDGLNTSSKVCVIASTNRIDIIDEAIKRPGRFDYKIEIKKPSMEGCKSIFSIHTDKMPVDPEFDKYRFVEEYLYGCSGADIAFIANEAAYNSIRRTVDIDELFSGKSDIAITENNLIIGIDFSNAVKKLKESNAQIASAKYRY